MWLRLVFCVVSYCLIEEILGQIEDKELDSNTISSLSTAPNVDYAPENPVMNSIPSSASRPSFTIEILGVFVPPGIGNSVKLVWGKKLDNVNLNMTYNVHYGKEEKDLTEPKLTTSNESAIIEDLDFCTKYYFAVSVGNENKINPNDVRTIITYLDPKAPPENAHIDFEPGEKPCLLIKWSASCANIGQAVGYVISAFDHGSSRYRIVTLPPSNSVDFVYHFPAHYGAKFDIKVSVNFPGSKATETVTYKVPNFLQPYKVRVTSNPEAGAFMIYWQEPYIPYFIDRLYYEVYIYRGFNVSENYERYYVTRPVLIYKGNETLYTFSVGAVSYDEEYRSLLTDPIVADIYGDVHQLR